MKIKRNLPNCQLFFCFFHFIENGFAVYITGSGFWGLRSICRINQSNPSIFYGNNINNFYWLKYTDITQSFIFEGMEWRISNKKKRTNLTVNSFCLLVFIYTCINYIKCIWCFPLTFRILIPIPINMIINCKTFYFLTIRCTECSVNFMNCKRMDGNQ